MYGTTDNPMIAMPSYKLRDVRAFKFYYVQSTISAKQRNIMLIERTNVAPVGDSNVPATK